MHRALIFNKDRYVIADNIEKNRDRPTRGLYSQRHQSRSELSVQQMLWMGARKMFRSQLSIGEVVPGPATPPPTHTSTPSSDPTSDDNTFKGTYGRSLLDGGPCYEVVLGLVLYECLPHIRNVNHR